MVVVGKLPVADQDLLCGMGQFDNFQRNISRFVVTRKVKSVGISNGSVGTHVPENIRPAGIARTKKQCGNLFAINTVAAAIFCSHLQIIQDKHVPTRPTDITVVKPRHREGAFILRRIPLESDAHLLQVIGALGALARVQASLHRRNGQPRQKPENRHHHQKLSQGEGRRPVLSYSPIHSAKMPRRAFSSHGEILFLHGESHPLAFFVRNRSR